MYLTQAKVDALKPKHRAYTVRDGSVPGLSLRVRKNGLVTYRMSYTLAGKRRAMDLGYAVDMDLEAARAKAVEIRRTVAEGYDPEIRVSGRTLGAFVDEFYLPGYVDTRLKKKTAYDARRRLYRAILPRFKGTPLDALDRRAVREWHLTMSSTPHEANRCLALLSGIYTYAKEVEALPYDYENPTRGVRNFREKRRVRRVTSAELQRLSLTAKAWPHRESAHIVFLLLLTGCRKSEIRDLEWSDVRADLTSIELHDSKTGPRSVALSATAQKILRTRANALGGIRAAVAGAGGADTRLWGPVFPECRRRQRFEYEWRKMRDEAGLEGVRLHDLRHAFASTAHDLGVPMQQLQSQLGHKSHVTTQHYLAADDRGRQRVVAAVDKEMNRRVAG